MILLVRGQPASLLRTLLLRDLLVVQRDARTEITAQVLQEYALWHVEGNWRPQMMGGLKERARQGHSMAAWLWAGVFEGMAHEHAGDVECAEAAYSLAASAAAPVSRCLPRVCAIAELARVLAQRGKTCEGQAVLARTQHLVADAPLFGRARWLLADGVVRAQQGETAVAAETLRRSAETALQIPNPFLAAEAESMLSSVCRSRGDLDGADAAAARAAALYFHVGRREKAAKMLEDTLTRRGPSAAQDRAVNVPAQALTPAGRPPG